jgi:hypothetical protein
MPLRFADARPGDRYCWECDFLLLREVLGSPALPLQCPTHPAHVFAAGVGPGALNRREALSLAYGSSWLRYLRAQARTSTLIETNRALRRQLAGLRESSPAA